MRLSERTSRSSSGSDRSPRASVVMGITVSAGVYTLRGFRFAQAATPSNKRYEPRDDGGRQNTRLECGRTRQAKVRRDRRWNGLSEGDDIEGRERRSSDPNEGNTHEEWRPRARVTGERETKKHSELEEATLGGEGVRLKRADVSSSWSRVRCGRPRSSHSWDRPSVRHNSAAHWGRVVEVPERRERSEPRRGCNSGARPKRSRNGLAQLEVDFETVGSPSTRETPIGRCHSRTPAPDELAGPLATARGVRKAPEAGRGVRRIGFPVLALASGTELRDSLDIAWDSSKNFGSAASVKWRTPHVTRSRPASGLGARRTKATR